MNAPRFGLLARKPKIDRTFDLIPGAGSGIWVLQTPEAKGLMTLRDGDSFPYVDWNDMWVNTSHFARSAQQSNSYIAG
jgi:hypothetical protein